MGKIVRVCDIVPEVLQFSFHTLRLARAVTDGYLDNGAIYLAVHAAPSDLRDFFLTAIIDETSPNQSDQKEKLMVQGGTQYGCSAHLCPFCVYSGLRFYRNLDTEEIVDLFRLALFLHWSMHNHKRDVRQLCLKFTDNGGLLETPHLPEVLDRLLALFGIKGKILRLKISTIFMDTEITRQTFQKVMEWQEQHRESASIHLQISRSPYGKRLIPADEVHKLIRVWMKANPNDRICIAPGLARGYNQEEFMAFCTALKPLAGSRCFFRLGITASEIALHQTVGGRRHTFPST
ncbi:MAG: hypothetical protein HZC26_00535 [Candidatus Magasanikbacteria bacterium]|nr:hypothetical protein [Candidatus Magasanikbacteria bacterium]